MARHHQGYLLLLVIIVSIEKPAGAQTIWPCPLPEEFAPCVCSTDSDSHLNADCSQVKSESELATAFSARFSLLTFNKLTIDHDICEGQCLLTTLSQTTFGPISFVEVDIQHTDITTVGESAFANSQHTLKSLILSHNQISSFTFQAIGEFEYLTELSLLSNKFDASTPIPNIESASLERLVLSSNPGLTFTPSLVTGCPKLKNLFVKGCEIQSVEMNVIDVSGMFYGLSAINHINFGDNLITALGTASIDQGVAESTLGLVDFSGNNIGSVSKNFVSGFGPDGLLDMSNNAIEEIYEDMWVEVFEELKALDAGDGKINLSGNPLLCGCDMSWLVRNSDRTLLNMITPDSTCRDGVTLVTELPEIAFDECPLKMGKIN